MKGKKQMPRLLSKILILICLVLLVLGTVSGGAYSKFRNSVMMTDQLSVTNKLADGFVLVEHKAALQEDGSYELTAQTVTADDRYLIPGTAIPMDPYISITNKTEIDAFLYVEVIDENDEDALSYELTADWTLLENATGYHGGSVYVYKGGVKLNNETDAAQLLAVGILKDDQILLGKEPLKDQAKPLRFCGYLIQASGDESAEALFNARFPKN